MTLSGTIPEKQFLRDTLQPFEEIWAAALYGSVARGDSEWHSDVDLLVICAGGRKRDVYDRIYPLLSNHFERLSLSVYSAREINFLSKAKSLFLLHLQRESVILFDRTLLLTGVLENFEPKQSYGEDFRKSLDLIAPLNSIVSGSPNDFHRLAYLYSLFRVFGVYLLAERRIFEFSKAKMTASLCAIFPEQAANITLLSKLRVLNANFFSGGEVRGELCLEVTGQLPALQTCMAALGDMVNNPVKMAAKNYPDAVQEFLDATQYCAFSLGYRLRTWFLLLVYDGLNLYCRNKHIQELSSFNSERLLEFTSERFPEAVRVAAAQSIEYLRNYPLKYFLLEESKIPLSRACTILTELAQEL
jgi:predicted nucleotidyltransferase